MFKDQTTTLTHNQEALLLRQAFSSTPKFSQATFFRPRIYSAGAKCTTLQDNVLQQPAILRRQRGTQAWTRAPTSSSTSTAGAGGPFSATGPALLTAQSPVVFMELGPGSITIDSISTAVINDLPTPLDRIVDHPENTIPTASSAVDESPSSQPGSASSQSRAQTAGAATVTTSSGTTGTRASPGPFRGLGPLSFPLGTALGGALGSPFDPCLPCNSFWTHSQGGTGHLVGSGGSPSQGARTASQGPTQTPQPANQHDDQLHQMLNGLMTALLHQPHLVLQRQHMHMGQGSGSESSGSRPRATLAGMMPGRSRHMAMRQTPLVYRGNGPATTTSASGPSTATAELGQHRRLGPGGSLWPGPSSGSAQQGPSSATAVQQQQAEKQPASAEARDREPTSGSATTATSTLETQVTQAGRSLESSAANEPIANAEAMFGLSDSVNFGSSMRNSQDAAATAWAGIRPDTVCTTPRNPSPRDTNETRQPQDGSAFAADVAESTGNSVPLNEVLLQNALLVMQSLADLEELAAAAKRIQGGILAARAYRPPPSAAMSVEPRCAWNGGATAAQARRANASATFADEQVPRGWELSDRAVDPYAYALRMAHDSPVRDAPRQEREADTRPGVRHATERQSYDPPVHGEQRPGRRGFSGRCYQCGAMGHIAR
ncbi:hypothetical protein HPB50_001939 [Hyalomma asiaticum]|uniref:Uncharacterized protein n=1 Tax=Hyalomma asiaticum TaxID=266040 RepID=A0ACB7TB02_HYAAI|nr:hypothetical protein HPB50_001939 [Hyalomma asiaticum]